MIVAAMVAEGEGNYQVGRTITFGQPKVTNVNGMKKLKRHALLRVVNWLDPVTLVPNILFYPPFEQFKHISLRPAIFFRHVGQRMMLFPETRSRNFEPNKLFYYMSVFAGLNVNSSIQKLLENHYIDTYIHRLNIESRT